MTETTLFGLRGETWLAMFATATGFIFSSAVGKAVPSPSMKGSLVPRLGISESMSRAVSTVGKGVLTGAGFTLGALLVGYFLKDWILENDITT